jgi:hypothetical protein
MLALENDDELTLSYRKMLLPLALGIIRVAGYVATNFARDTRQHSQAVDAFFREYALVLFPG